MAAVHAGLAVILLDGGGLDDAKDLGAVDVHNLSGFPIYPAARVATRQVVV